MAVSKLSHGKDKSRENIEVCGNAYTAWRESKHLDGRVQAIMK